MRHIFLSLSVLLATSVGQTTQAANTTSEFVELQTNLGTITVQLDYVHAPISATNFITYVQSGFYNNTLMHRVVKGFVVQGGGYNLSTAALKSTRAAITLESNNGLSNIKGSLAMARTNDANSATSQFFINTVDNTYLDYQSPSSPGYAVFGKVVQGLNIVSTIENLPNVSSVAFSGTSGQVVFVEKTYTNATLDTTLAKTRITLSGSGIVTSTPTGINCGTACSMTQQRGAALKLTAKAKAGFVFSGWRGDCQSNNANITVNTQKGNHNCTAVFTALSTATQ